MNVRQLAVQALTPLLNDSSSLKYSLKKQLELCPENQRPFLQELCYGSMRYFPRLNSILSKLVTKPLRSKDSDIKALLIIGLYQLNNLRTAEHAAISETVDVCKSLNKPWATSLVNATLRNFQREKKQLAESLSEDIPFKYNHPDWFVNKLMHNWPDHWIDILNANDDHPPLTIRVNSNIVSRETYANTLLLEDITSNTTSFSQTGLTLDKPTDITKLNGFDNGTFSVQDEAAQMAAVLVNPMDGENILDACSAPGGKLLHLLELAKDKQTTVQGIELEASRAERIKENFTRLGMDCPLHIADATTQGWWDGKLFDKILLDAPCSATGVIRRNPDIKLLRKAEDIHSVAKLQKQILENMWAMLKKGGTIVYATCSIFPQENEKIVASFIKNNDDAEHVKIAADWGYERDFGRQLFPKEKGHDGFYYAMIRKL